MRSPDRTRRGVIVLSLLGLAGCGTTPPLRWHRLPLAARTPPATGAAAAAATPARDERWELVREVTLPEYLQSDTLFIDAGNGQLQPLPQDRWAEPLQDAVPRLLLSDLQSLRGADRVWLAPAPLDVKAQQRLRVQLLALDAEAARGQLLLQARCTWQPLQAGGTSRVQVFEVLVPLPDGSAASLVQAHRSALLALATRIAAV